MKKETIKKTEVEEEVKEQASGWSVARVLKLTYPKMKGDDVTALQNALISRGYACGRDSAEGIFDKDTCAAVRAFQGSERLTVNGIAGKQTIAALGGEFKA